MPMERDDSLTTKMMMMYMRNFSLFSNATVNNTIVQEDFEDYESPGDSARALVLSLSVCYHARLENREEYEEGVAGYFTGPIELIDGADQFRDEMRW